MARSPDRAISLTVGLQVHQVEGDLRSGIRAESGDPRTTRSPDTKVTRHSASIRLLRIRERVAEALLSVGLRAEDAAKYPHEFSGGQRQRIAIARAIITRPALIVADEPVSALDVSVQAQVLNLIQDMRERFGIAYLFISHNLAVVRHIADEVAVMQQGRFVERGSVGDIFQNPKHPYTRALLAAMLKPEARRRSKAPAL